MHGRPCHFSALPRKAPRGFWKRQDNRGWEADGCSSKRDMVVGFHGDSYINIIRVVHSIKLPLTMEHPPFKEMCFPIGKKVDFAIPTLLANTLWSQGVTLGFVGVFRFPLLRGVNHVSTHPAWTKRHHWHHHTIWNAVVPTSRELDGGKLGQKTVGPRKLLKRSFPAHFVYLLVGNTFNYSKY